MGLQFFHWFKTRSARPAIPQWQALRSGGWTLGFKGYSRKPAFLPRLPETVDKTTILAMTAVGDSLLIVTQAGDMHVRMRFYDAVQELKAFDGIQTHRAWWVMKSAVRNVVRYHGKYTLRLTNDRLVPVSRTYKKRLRRQGWI